MSAVSSRRHAGFTLVEILIVVIILGILAAIVIPQFTDASQSAKTSSLVSQVQTIRSQLELFKSAHSAAAANKLFATATSDKTQWQELTSRTDVEGALSASGAYGPYLQTLPLNNLNGKGKVQISTTTVDESTFVPAAGCGFVYDTTTGKFWATDKDIAKIYVPTN